ncbi:conjugal transfer protein TraF [Acidovorax sp. LjRoot129]|uniref:conjugal transfer protein TraF n=1 Tax=unclassified Acidovorax TaxID=2684926 RepID=UPI003ECE79CB
MRGLILTRSAFLLAALLTLCGLAAAQSESRPARDVNMYKSGEEGWFWYEREPEPLKEEKKPLPKKAPPTPSIIKLEAPKAKAPEVEPLSVKWFQQEYMSVIHAAIDDPSEANVRNYRYATRVMLDKASNFTRQFQKQSLLDTLLDESVRSPFSSGMRGSFQGWSIDAKRAATKGLNKKAGLWVFLDDQCPFCAMQYPIVARLAKELQFEVFYITPDGKRPSWLMGGSNVLKDEGQSKTLRIGVRPAVALVVPPAKVTVITQGLLSQDLLEERILIAGDAAGLITGVERKNAFPEERGILTPEDIKELGKEMLKDKNALTPGAQQRLEKRY